ncbi:hypothetical protein CVT25_003585 [Psilocybe cyanescens]|uniref:DUF5077 domain-containing protein n=1 Tax=Psilocybe cyanescens TaxID=93625 RepID=A0A409X6P0_PSICY|nr:hypothetical protein CVT25_003585 [Psilocybe cyanescens]
MFDSSSESNMSISMDDDYNSPPTIVTPSDVSTRRRHSFLSVKAASVLPIRSLVAAEEDYKSYRRICSVAGNAFITTASAGASEVINDNGLANWNSASTITSAYFRMASAGSATIGLDAYLAGGNNSTVRITVNGTAFTVQLAGTAPKTYPVGTINVAAQGYVKVDLQGVTKDWRCVGLECDRGLCNQLRQRPRKLLLVIPRPIVGQDVVGSYFMVAGFDGGYSGIQVKENQRWVLFSVWDADNGQKTTLVNKGAEVVDNSMGVGGEATGGQVYLVFNWVAGNMYKFITRTRPDGAGSTLYSAWFFAPESNTWRYLATWERPSTTAYQSGTYSFLENFIDTKGYTGRRVLFGNQWARNVNGTWSELTAARYTGDATASNAQRMDYAGGVDSRRFYLRNGGLFADYVSLNQNFTRAATGLKPTVDVGTLPTQ